MDILHDRAERTDAVDRAGIAAFRGILSSEPARQLILSVRVRHDVADVAVLLTVERSDSTCCFASSILPGRARQRWWVRSSRHNVASSMRRAAQARAVTATASSKVVGNQDGVVKVNPGEAS